MKDNLKRCGTCREYKDRSQFSKNKNNKDGLSYRCKPCGRSKAKQWRLDNQERRKRYRHGADLKRYNITIENYEYMLKKQDGKCYICGALPEKNRRLSIDHDHRCCPDSRSCCGKCIRTLLCNKCNLMLGYCNEDLDQLGRLMEYLIDFQSQANT